MVEHSDSVAKTDTGIWRRVVDLEAGTAMVVTDLHGDWDAYQRYRDRFLDLQAQGKADFLILDGDLIHRKGPPQEDSSLEMVLDVMALQEELGPHLIYLFGNHELPHIYSILLQERNGNYLYTPPFETAMGDHRQQIVAFFKSLPFYVRTRAGVSIAHAGATAVISEHKGTERLFNYSHERVWQESAASISPEERPSLCRAIRRTYNKTYNEIVRTHFAVNGLNDPRYDDFLVGTVAANSHPEFELLWPAVFNRNEYEYGESGYSTILKAMLQTLSADFYPQKAMVTGHIDCKGGYKIVARQQLRLASAKHARPREAGRYLLFDMEDQRVNTAEDLLAGLDSVF